MFFHATALLRTSGNRFKLTPVCYQRVGVWREIGSPRGRDERPTNSILPSIAVRLVTFPPSGFEPLRFPKPLTPLIPMPLFADAWTATSFELSLMAAAVFGLLGIAMLALGFKVFEWITPRLNVEQELVKGNIAVGIMVAALLLSISFIVVRAIGG